jgi:aminopeptidase N
MFKVTQTGMKFYRELFGQEYPFEKYDQIYVPEFNAGAMENVGCVTYNEDMLFRGEDKTMDKKMQLTITNLHELAHHWFGNLVTMKWWDDLWLNESFATYMSYLALTSIPELKNFHGVWTDFLAKDKAQAM